MEINRKRTQKTKGCKTGAKSNKTGKITELQMSWAKNRKRAKRSVFNLHFSSLLFFYCFYFSVNDSNASKSASAVYAFITFIMSSALYVLSYIPTDNAY